MAEKSKMEGKSCSKVTKNPFFNFLRCYRAQAMNQHCTAVETAVKGAKIWQKLSTKQREPFQKMAEPLLKPGVVRKPRSSVPRRRRARASRSHSRIRRTTTAGRKRSATRRRSTTRHRSATRRSATRRTTRRSATRRSTTRRSATRRSTTRRSTTRRSATQHTTRRSASRRRKATTAPSAKRRSRSRSATKKRATTRQRAASSTKRRKSATRGRKAAMTGCATVARTSRKRTGRKRSRSRSRSRSAPAKRIRRSKKARSTSRKRGRPAGTRGRPRRSKTVKLESFTSPAGCDVCPKPSVSAKAPTSGSTEGTTIAPATGSVLMSASINEACNTSMGATIMPQESFENKMVADEPGSPVQFHVSSDKLVVGREMDLNVSTNKRMAEGKKPTRNRSVLSEDEAASAGGQEPAKRRRR